MTIQNKFFAKNQKLMLNSVDDYSNRFIDLLFDPKKTLKWEIFLV